MDDGVIYNYIAILADKKFQNKKGVVARKLKADIIQEHLSKLVGEEVGIVQASLVPQSEYEFLPQAVIKMLYRRLFFYGSLLR